MCQRPIISFSLARIWISRLSSNRSPLRKVQEARLAEPDRHSPRWKVAARTRTRTRPMIGAAWFAIMVIVIGGPCALIASVPSSHGSWTSVSSGRERSFRRRRRRERESGSEGAPFADENATQGLLRTAARSRVLARCVRRVTRTHSNWRAISPTVSPCRRVSLSAHSTSARYAADPPPLRCARRRGRGRRGIRRCFEWMGWMRMDGARLSLFRFHPRLRRQIVFCRIKITEFF